MDDFRARGFPRGSKKRDEEYEISCLLAYVSPVTICSPPVQFHYNICGIRRF